MANKVPRSVPRFQSRRLGCSVPRTISVAPSALLAKHRIWLGSARASTTLPHSATKVTSTYEWTDYSALMPTHYYLTQKAYPEPGLNIYIRQPIPAFQGLPGRLEATLDLRNVMAQGYLQLAAGERRVLLMQNPRALRAGLSFIF